jgi:hypothetical protein
MLKTKHLQMALQSCSFALTRPAGTVAHLSHRLILGCYAGLWGPYPMRKRMEERVAQGGPMAATKPDDNSLPSPFRGEKV